MGAEELAGFNGSEETNEREHQFHDLLDLEGDIAESDEKETDKLQEVDLIDLTDYSENLIMPVNKRRSVGGDADNDGQGCNQADGGGRLVPWTTCLASRIRYLHLRVRHLHRAVAWDHLHRPVAWNQSRSLAGAALG